MEILEKTSMLTSDEQIWSEKRNKEVPVNTVRLISKRGIVLILVWTTALGLLMLQNSIDFGSLSKLKTGLLNNWSSYKIISEMRTAEPIGSIPNSNRMEVSGSDTNITVVAAYFKTSKCILEQRPSRPEETYIKWASNIFGAVKNPMIIYSDSHHFIDAVNQARSDLSQKTKYEFIRRNDLWAFQQQKKIEKLTSPENRDKFFPESSIWNVNLECSDYSMINHAKFDLLEISAKENPFGTEYISWLDVGCFRSIQDCPTLELEFRVPENLKENAFSAGEKRKVNLNTVTMESVLFLHTDWLGGPSFIAKANVWVDFSRQYRSFFECMLRNNMTNTDQSVLIGMYAKSGRKLCPDVEISVPVQAHLRKEAGSRFRSIANGFLTKCRDDNVLVDGIFYLCYKLAYFP